MFAKVKFYELASEAGENAVKRIPCLGKFAVFSREGKALYLIHDGCMSALNMGGSNAGLSYIPKNLIVPTGKETIGVDNIGALTSIDPYSAPHQIHIFDDGEFNVYTEGKTITGEEALNFLKDINAGILSADTLTGYKIRDPDERKIKDAKLTEKARSIGVDAVVFG